MKPSTDTVVTVRVDERTIDIHAGSTLADLVTQLGHEQNAVTTAVNGQFVPRGHRAARILCADDAVMLFKPVGGG